MEVIFYSTNCPKCKVLMTKMKQKGINYKEITDINLMKEKKIMSAPMLEINNKLMDFTESIKWVNNQ